MGAMPEDLPSTSEAMCETETTLSNP